VTIATVDGAVVATDALIIAGSGDVTVSDSDIQDVTSSSLTGDLDYTQTSTTDLTMVTGSGDDSITLAVTGSTVDLTLGAGDDTVDAKTIATTTLVVDGGAGDDTIDIDVTVAAATIVFAGGDGDDTVLLSDAGGAVDLSGATVTLAGVENLDIEGGATVDDGHVSGTTLNIIGEGAGTDLTVSGDDSTTAPDTIDLSGLTFDTGLTTAVDGVIVDAGTGADTVTLSTVADTILHVIGDSIATVAGADTYVDYAVATLTSAGAVSTVTDFFDFNGSVMVDTALDTSNANVVGVTDGIIQFVDGTLDFADLLADAWDVADTDLDIAAFVNGGNTYIVANNTTDSLIILEGVEATALLFSGDSATDTLVNTDQVAIA
jgi:hypothetical protein